MTEISKEYAMAIYELGAEQKREKEYLDALKLINSELSEMKDYAELLSSPNISAKERCSLAEEAFGGKVPEQVLHFLLLLCEKGRVKIFADCVDEYEKMYRMSNTESKAKIVSAAPLSDSQKETLVKKLEKINGGKVDAVYEIDESLLGGFTVYMDDKVIDGSIKSKLKDIKEGLNR